jgi:RNA polymerase sigma-70 factor (ECF subfamily)
MVTPERPEESASIDSETLFNRYASFVASFLYRMGARGAEIDDMVQDVFLTAHRKGGYRPGPASPTTFLARLALEAKLATRRRDSRWQGARTDETAQALNAGPPADPQELLAAKRAAARLDEALGAMDPGHRAVFVLFEFEGQSCDAIAAGLDLKVGTVYSRLHAARGVFRAAVMDHRRRSGGDSVPRSGLGAKESV